MLAFYRERFANAADFTFFMVGAFKVDDAIPLLARYVGIAAVDRQADVARSRTSASTSPPAIERVRVEKGREPRSQTVISFFADPSPDPASRRASSPPRPCSTRAARRAARGSRPDLHRLGRPVAAAAAARRRAHPASSFGAAPENIQSMTDRVLQEIKRLQQEGPSADLTAEGEGSGAARLRDVAEAERILAAAAADGPHARRRPAARS